MKRSAPMKRTGFKRVNLTMVQALDAAKENHQKAAAVHPATRRAVIARVSEKPAAAIPKESAVRSDKYLRLVAMYPCKNCGIAGYSQAAHLNRGKGLGIKTDDRMTAPLCADRPGVVGCHTRFDRYELFSAEVAAAVMQAWIADTQRQIEAAGLWPANLPKRSES